MITATMTAQDIWNCTSKDAEFIERAAQRVAWGLTKDATKRRTDAVWKCIDYVRDGVKYKVVVCGRRDRTWLWFYYVYVPERNIYVRIARHRADGSLYLAKMGTQAYTPHFIRRVSERLYHDSAFDLNRTLARLNRDMFVSKRQILVCLYFNESTENTVHRFLDGIALGENRKAEGYVEFKTFVSHDMLKGSQRRAFDACTSLQTTMHEKYGDDEEIGHRLYIDDAFADALDKELDACKPIYAEFFKKK